MAAEHEQERIVATGDAATIQRLSAQRTRRSFVVGGVAAAAAYGASQMIANSKPVWRLQADLRDVLNANAAVNRAVFDERGLAPTYPVSEARPLRLNGTVGMEEPLVMESWRLQLVGAANATRSPRYAPDVTAWEYKYGAASEPDAGAIPDLKEAPKPAEKSSALNPGGASDSDAGAALAARIEAMVQQQSKKSRQGDAEAGPSASSLDRGTPGLLLTMDDLKALPWVEFVTEFKCIEGWSSKTQWGGVRLRDLLEAHPPETVDGREPQFVYMETPNGNYYGGYDMAAARHPQSLLVMQMGGQPLSPEHGAPLRLHMPIKYGYKQLKRVGLIAYTAVKPDDYWTKLGYDWYAGL